MVGVGGGGGACRDLIAILSARHSVLLRSLDAWCDNAVGISQVSIFAGFTFRFSSFCFH